MVLVLSVQSEEARSKTVGRSRLLWGNPESGTTGWCVDSSGNSKSINEDFENPGRLVGGRGVLAACP